MSTERIRYNPYLPGFSADPYRQYRSLRAHDPVHRSFMGTWVVSRYDDVCEALKDPRLSSELHHWTGFARRYKGRSAVAWLLTRSVLNTDPPRHTQIKKALAKAFDASQREALTAVLRRFFAEQVAEAGRNGRTFDAIQKFALTVPLRTVSHLFGLSDGEQAMVKGWSNHVAGLIEPLPTAQALNDAERSVGEFRDWIENRLRHDSGADTLPDRIGRLLRRGEIGVDDAVANLILLYPAGHETTVNLLGNGLLTLVRHPDQMERLRSDLGLMNQAIEEILRFEPPQQVAWRNAIEDIEIGGTEIRKGEQLMLLLGAANRDPDVFPGPDRFDIGRKPNPHLSFGMGRHACLGAWFARLQGAVGLTALLQEFEELGLAGQPEWHSTMSFHGLKTLPIRLSADPRRPGRRQVDPQEPAPKAGC